MLKVFYEVNQKLLVNIKTYCIYEKKKKRKEPKEKKIKKSNVR